MATDGLRDRAAECLDLAIGKDSRARTELVRLALEFDNLALSSETADANRQQGLRLTHTALTKPGSRRIP